MISHPSLPAISRSSVRTERNWNEAVLYDYNKGNKGFEYWVVKERKKKSNWRDQEEEDDLTVRIYIIEKKIWHRIE